MSETDQLEMAKRFAAERACEFVRSGMVVGLGTGSTAYYAIRRLGELVADGLLITGVPTSDGTSRLAQSFGIPLTTLEQTEKIDVAIDGADEVTIDLALVKGRGGALVREKIVAEMSDLFVVAVDSRKCVQRLGAATVPVEVVPFGWPVVHRRLVQLGAAAELRLAGDQPFVTDNHNYVIDCDFGFIEDPVTLETRINGITGVVDNGLFVGLADVVVIGAPSGTTIRRGGRAAKKGTHR